MVAFLADAFVVFALVFLLAVAATWVIVRSPLGLRLQQTANRKRIERGHSLVCALHGVQAAADLVRLPSGETICPRCYQEVRDADLY